MPCPAGVIEVATNEYGLTRMHHIRDDGTEHALSPHPRSQEGLRARFGQRFPRTSVVLGAAAVVVLLAVLAVGMLSGLEALTRVEVIAERVGTVTSPIHVTGWMKIALPVAGFVAGLERALTLRHHRLLRG